MASLSSNNSTIALTLNGTLRYVSSGSAVTFPLSGNKKEPIVYHRQSNVRCNSPKYLDHIHYVLLYTIKIHTGLNLNLLPM